MTGDGSEMGGHAGRLCGLASAQRRWLGRLLIPVLLAAIGLAGVALISRTNTTGQEVADLLAESYVEYPQQPGPLRSLLMRARLVKPPGPPDRGRITDELAVLGRPAVPHLIRALDDREYAWLATEALGKIGPDATAATPRLIRHYRLPSTPDCDWGVVCSSIDLALLRIGAGDRTGRVVRELERALNGPIERERSGVAYVLGHLHREGRSTVDVLTRALTDTRSAGRVQAAYGLGIALQDRRDSPEVPPAVAALVDALEQDEDDRLRGAAIRALGSLRTTDGAAIAALVSVFVRSRNRCLTYHGAKALTRIGPPANVAIPALLDIVERRAPGWRDARWALWHIGPPRRSDIPAVRLALFTCDDDVRFHAARGLAAHGLDSPEVVTALLETCMTHRALSARAAAKETLARLGHHDVTAVADMVGWALATERPAR